MLVIDWQHHFAPEEAYLRGGKPGQAMYERGQVGAHLREEIYQVEKHLKFMDEAGIDMAVLSSPTVHSVQECKMVHDAYAELTEKYPNRFLCLAYCIPALGDDALVELDRAINSLGLKGVQINAQVEGVALDSQELWPFYETVSKLEIPIFVHVTFSPIGYGAFDAKYNFNVTLTREVDLANSTMRIILGGVLTKFPELRFVFSHMGGGISAVKERIVRYVDVWEERFWTENGGTPPFGKPYGKNFNDCFDKIYFDMAGFEGGMNAVKCALTTISPERLVFATDYPFNFTYEPEKAARYINNIKALDLPSGSIGLMLGGNAAKLLRVQ